MSYAARTFGITSNTGALSGGLIVNSLNSQKTTDVAEARNEKGQIIDLAAYSLNETLSIDGLFVGNGVEPGTVVTVGSKEYLVTDSSKTESNTDFQQGSISCRRSDEATLHPLSGIVGTGE